MNKKNVVDNQSTKERILWVRQSTSISPKRKTIVSRIIKEWLYQKYIRENYYAYEIAKQIGVCPQTIFNWLKIFNIPSRRPGQELDKNPLWTGGIQRRNFTLYLKQPFHPNADKQGYVSIARLKAEKALGRFLNLNKKEMIHHININPSDNRNENLLISNKGYHKWLHWKIKKLGLEEYFKNLKTQKEGR